MKLTKKQRQLVKIIRRLHRQREPLNITAVKRDHPELIEAVYAVKPYWGWKRALEASGLSYHDVKVHVAELVRCLICGKKFRQLPHHLAKKHEITTEEYQSDYPDAELVAEELRAAKLGLAPQDNSPSRKLLDHWEPLWSPEYVLDRIAEYHKRGYPLYMRSIQLKEPALVMEVLKYFHSWDRLLTKIGLNPAQIRRCFPSPFQSKAQVIRAIKYRHHCRLPLHTNEITKGEKANNSLFKAGCRIFGSWEAAIEAAGFNYELIRWVHVQPYYRQLPLGPSAPQGQPPKLSPPRQHPLGLPVRYLSPAAVIKLIRLRWKAGLPMHCISLQKGPYVDYRLFKIAKHFFKTWQTAATAAGIPNVDIFGPNKWTQGRNPRRFPTKDSVIAEIKRRKDQGLPLNNKALQCGHHRNLALLGSARTYFGSWPAAIEATGLDYSSIKLPNYKPRYPTKESVLKRIQARKRQNRPLNVGGLYKGRWRERALYDSARRFFVCWRAAIEAAGLDYSSVRLPSHKLRYPTKEAVLQRIQARMRQHRPLNFRALHNGHWREHPLHHSAQRLFGSWRAAIEQAGYSYNRIAKRIIRNTVKR